jgi:predicted nucleotide-binding protein (sugar kinase/HSP70/actin superfamily)
MGTLHIILKALLERMGVNVIVPPPTSKRTIELGVKHSPEFACLPLKINIGNFIEALEAGADTIVMGGGVGPCRFGYYGEVQKEILNNLGYDFEIIILEPPQGHLKELYDKIRLLTGGASLADIYRAMRFAWDKIMTLEAVEREVHRRRPREVSRGTVTAAYQQALRLIDAAATPPELQAAKDISLAAIESVPVKPEGPVLRIGIVGEVYMVLEPFLNFEVEKTLEEMGVHVDRSVYIGDWVRSNLLLDAIHLRDDGRVRAAAKPYLNHFVGGHGQETVAHTVLYARHGYDGIVQVAPFTCMPEIVAESILPHVSRNLSIPVLTFFLDEHSAEAGCLTRLEAFVDLLERRKEMKEGSNYGRISGN